jgi:hypothetical protein
VTEATPVETATADVSKLQATPHEVELAYLRAAERYGYSAHAASYSEDEDEGSHDGAYDEGYEGAGYGDEDCR